jgi:hypothetical protein
MADEKKLGPNVTYVDKDKDGTKSVTVDGVFLEAGKATNIVEALGEARAAPILKKLSGNPYFKVDGGPDHQAEDKKKQEFEKQQEERRRQLQDEESKRRQDEERAKSDEATRKAQEAAEAYKGPDEATLEKKPAASAAKK